MWQTYFRQVNREIHRLPQNLRHSVLFARKIHVKAIYKAIDSNEQVSSFIFNTRNDEKETEHQEE